MEFLGIDLRQLIEAVGYIGVLAMVFAESGLLIGIFLPGDSLLFTAGFLASVGVFNFPLLALGCFLAAVLGDNVGYAFGKRVGPRIFNRTDSFWFHRRNLERAEKFYEKHGPKTIVIARFVPVVRTFAPIVAGVGNMHYQTFFFYNILGGLLWAVGLTSLGYFLGKSIPDIEKYILPALVVIVVLSFFPVFLHWAKEKFSN